MDRAADDYGHGEGVGIGGRGNRQFWHLGYGLEAALVTLDVGSRVLELDRIGARPGRRTSPPSACS